ncbi:MAG: hypothetical protein VSS75_028120 [Candidatus Parabeggiatoa sp.]|nr:hypothetical protein [Candidatus Parabeggiatoa sp.]
MTLLKLTLATAGILIMGISLTACTATNSKPSGSQIPDDCPKVPDVKNKVTVPIIDKKPSTINPEPPQKHAGCTLQELDK